MPRRDIRNNQNEQYVESSSSDDGDQEGRYEVESVTGIRTENGQVSKY